MRRERLISCSSSDQRPWSEGLLHSSGQQFQTHRDRLKYFQRGRQLTRQPAIPQIPCHPDRNLVPAGIARGDAQRSGIDPPHGVDREPDLPEPGAAGGISRPKHIGGTCITRIASRTRSGGSSMNSP
jgi:hypothetical protein